MMVSSRHRSPQGWDRPLSALAVLNLHNLFFALLAAALMAGSAAQARTREHFGEGFTIDLQKPPNIVIGIVREVAEDGVIQGTSEYRGTSELDGATPANSSDAFPQWTEGGTVLFKIRPNTLAPEHFRQSNDQGTVVIRYVIQPLGPNSAHLRIDATFQEDARHHQHPSDGQVEANEFEVIAAKLRELDAVAEQRQQEDARKQEQAKIDELRDELKKEEEQIQAAKAREKDLEGQVQQARGARVGHIRTSSADLKSAPYNASKTLELLSQGDAVSVLLETPHWFQVQAADGQKGWIYGLMLEVAP